MLRWAMLCQAMLCYAMLWYAMLSYFVPLFCSAWCIALRLLCICFALHCFANRIQNKKKAYTYIHPNVDIHVYTAYLCKQVRWGTLICQAIVYIQYWTIFKWGFGFFVIKKISSHRSCEPLPNTNTMEQQQKLQTALFALHLLCICIALHCFAVHCFAFAGHGGWQNLF